MIEPREATENSERFVQVEEFKFDKDLHFQDFGGQPFYPFDPMRSLGCITIGRLAFVLSSMNRFRGRTKRFYSVAEHSLWVSSLLPSNLELAGLIHDAHEAYSPFGDVCGPFKPAFIEDMEGEIDVAIAAKFQINVESFWHPDVHKADQIMLAQERWWLLDESSPQVNWDCVAEIPRDKKFESLTIPRSAEDVRISYETKLRTLLKRQRQSSGR